MRKYDIAYVHNPAHYVPPVDYMDMDVNQLKKKYIDTCAKSSGMISNCSRCGNPCVYGKRAIEILSGNNSDVPLYDGKTLIEKAKEENMLRRKEQTDKKISKDNRAYINDWYNKAIASENPVKWVMDAYNIDKTKAKAKLYQWRRRHNERKEEVKQEVESVMPIPESIETKLERLYKEKELIQENINKLQKQYEEINNKIDVLCSAMDIINE